MQLLTEKYRPRCFDEVIGQERIIKLLRSDFEKRNPGNLYLLSGKHGTGKTTVARLAALYMNCDDFDFDDPAPCLICDTCRSILLGTSQLMNEINAANYTGVEDARNLLLKFRHVVRRNKTRIVIIDEAHRMSKNAWDIYLKPTEDGMPNTIFFFCTTELEKVPKTIVSRSVNKGFHFTEVGIDPITRLLTYIAETEDIKAKPDAINQLIVETGGSVRDCVNALAAFYNVGEIDKDLIRRDYYGVDPAGPIELFNRLYHNNAEKAYWIVSGWLKEKLSAEEVFTLFTEHITNLLNTFILKYRGWDRSEVRKMESQRKEYGELLLGKILLALMDCKKYMTGLVSIGYAAQFSLVLSIVRHTINDHKASVIRKTAITTKASERDGVVVEKDLIKQAPSFPDRSDIDALTSVTGGRVTVYTPEKGRAMIFASDGQAVEIVVSPTKNRRYILVADIHEAASCSTIKEMVEKNILHEVTNEG